MEIKDQHQEVDSEVELDAYADALAALAQPTRLRLFKLLVAAADPSGQAGGMPAGELARTLDVSPSSLSFHLKALSWNKLVSARREGRSIIYSARFDRMEALLRFLLDDCCGGRCTPLTTRRQPAEENAQ